jgi:hypothetical protein
VIFLLRSSVEGTLASAPASAPIAGQRGHVRPGCGRPLQPLRVAAGAYDACGAKQSGVLRGQITGHPGDAQHQHGAQAGDVMANLPEATPWREVMLTYASTVRPELLVGSPAPLNAEASPVIFGDDDARFTDLTELLLDTIARLRAPGSRAATLLTRHRVCQASGGGKSDHSVDPSGSDFTAA